MLCLALSVAYVFDIKCLYVVIFSQFSYMPLGLMLLFSNVINQCLLDIACEHT